MVVDALRRLNNKVKIHLFMPFFVNFLRMKKLLKKQNLLILELE